MIGNLTDDSAAATSKCGEGEFKLDSELNPYYIQGFCFFIPIKKDL